ncbi:MULTISPECIES: polysaccharide biosynthesis/export family protein [Pseudomonas]|jgi:protein involved in polysaccharide export with SLBB domain|uniref:Capsular biosynthesis protein n=1 Tax=Pseudomonas syringae TaxID=317 RepID=A0A085ULU0_PSESX|nr:MULTISPECIES: polysaccharide biosynthesis/export family protein [Pseudomonas]EPJ85329.1 polysaccharide export protein [Pseudomonas sp. CFII64]KFE44153.1 capsular biosynthesis protein [Pseudomonas syringae]
MSLSQFCRIALLLILSSPLFAAPQYQLNSGDILRINVFGETDLSFAEIRLNDAGTFSYPFIGEVNAKGKTPGQVEALLTDKLKDGYLVAPRVSVSVLAYRPFYISGEVKLPGGYPFEPGLTLDRAIALAGGLTERASDRRIYIVRGADTRRSSQKASLNTLVEPGDTITIEQGFF